MKLSTIIISDERVLDVRKVSKPVDALPSQRPPSPARAMAGRDEMRWYHDSLQLTAVALAPSVRSVRRGLALAPGPRGDLHRRANL